MGADLRTVPPIWWLLGSLALVVGLQVLVVHLPVLQGLFDTVALHPQHWAAAAAIASLAVIVGELDKLARRHRRHGRRDAQTTAHRGDCGHGSH